MIKTSISRYGKRTLHNTSLHSCILEGKFGHFGHTKEPCKQSQSQEQHRKAPNPNSKTLNPEHRVPNPKSNPTLTTPAPLRTRLHTIHQRFIGSVRSRALATINQLGKILRRVVSAVWVQGSQIARLGVRRFGFI